MPITTPVEVIDTIIPVSISLPASKGVQVLISKSALAAMSCAPSTTAVPVCRLKFALASIATL